MKTSVLRLALLLSICLAATTNLSAIAITYTATGCFVDTPAEILAGTCTASASDSTGALAYAGNSATVNSLPELLVPQFGEESASASFGTFWFTALPAGPFNNVPFILTLSLTAPPPGGGDPSEPATVSGAATTVPPPGSNNVTITFNEDHAHPGTTPIFLYNLTGGGSISYHVQSITVPLNSTASQPTDLTSHFHVDLPNAVPEPGTYALLGSGLIFAGLLRRKLSRN